MDYALDFILLFAVELIGNPYFCNKKPKLNLNSYL